MGLLAKLIEVLFPERCIFCSRAGNVICGDCEAILMRARITEHLPPPAHADDFAAAMRYADAHPYARRMILRLKTRRSRALSTRAAEFIVNALQNNSYGGTADCVSFIPRSPRRKREAGYDQSELLAKEVSKRLGIPMLPLLKSASRREQKTLSAQGRQQNIAGRLTAKPLHPNVKTILLIDDLVTTGSTVSEACRVLKAVGATKVYAASLGKTTRTLRTEGNGSSFG